MEATHWVMAVERPVMLTRWRGAAVRLERLGCAINICFPATCFLAVRRCQPGPAAVCRASQASPIRFVVLLWGEASSNAASALGQRLLSFDAVLARGAGRTFHPPQDLSGSDLATLVYTSGTTGQPKVPHYCTAVLYCAVVYFTLCCAVLCRVAFHRRPSR